MSAQPLTAEVVAQLKSFVELCYQQPSILGHPQLSFFKDFIEKLGGKVPSPKRFAADPDVETAESEPAAAAHEPESEESDIELDMTGVIGVYLFILHRKYNNVGNPNFSPWH